MKIAITSTSSTLDGSVGTEFDCSKYLLIVDLDTREYEAIINPLLSLNGPAAGKMFAKQLLEKDVWVVLTSNYSSDVLKSLGDSGIRIIVGVSGSVRDAVEQFEKMCMADTAIISFEELQD